MIGLPQPKSYPSRSAEIVCISHLGDVDGCVCAALLRCVTGCSFHLTNYGRVRKHLRNIPENCNLVYFCDLGLNENVLEEFSRIRRFAELTYIDHHPLRESFSERLQGMGVNVVHDQLECASILTFNLLRGYLTREAGLLASYAAYADRLENGPIAGNIIKEYERDFVLFETMILSYSLNKAGVNLKRRIVCHLSNLEYPHQIAEVAELALTQADRTVTLRRELPFKASKLCNIAYAEAKEDSSGTVASLLLDVCEANIGIGYKIDQHTQTSDLSIRGKQDLKIDLGRTTFQLAESMGGFGGGHPRASGARIPTKNLNMFIKSLAQLSA